MARTFHQSFAHLVFSTKERRPMITATLEPELHAYLGGIIREMRGTSIRINGTADHVHLLIQAPKTVADADLMRVLKTNSSKWVKETYRGYGSFAWQEGYGWFSVSKSVVPEVQRYVEQQKEHHQKLGFKEEFRALLEKHGVEYDERFIWD